MKRVILTALFSFILMGKSFASFNVSLGNFSQYVAAYAEDNSNDTNLFDFNPYLALGHEFKFMNQVSFLSEAGLFLKNKRRDDNLNIITYFFHGSLAYKTDSLKLNVGLGFLNTRISADESSVVLQNGNDPGTPFPAPPDARTSTNLLTNIGAQILLDRYFSLTGSIHIYNLTDSEARALGYSLGVKFNLNYFSKRPKKKVRKNIRKRRLKRRRIRS